MRRNAHLLITPQKFNIYTLIITLIQYTVFNVDIDDMMMGGSDIFIA